MPDDLDRAVDAQIDAHRPDRVPPFDAIVARKRSRDRRRLATGGAALSAVAIAGAAVLAPSLAGGDGDRDRLPSYAAPAAPAPDFDVPDGYAGEYRQGTWVTRSVSADRRSVSVAVAGGGCTGYGRHETVREGDRLRLSVWVETLVPQDDSHGCARDFAAIPVAVDLPRPLGEDETLLGGCEDPESGADSVGCRGLGATPPEVLGEPSPAETGSARPEPPSAAALPVPGDPPGATICADAPAGAPGGGCRLVRKRQARELADALGTARRGTQGVAVRCAAQPTPYVVTFALDGGPAEPVYTVPSACAPVRLDGTSYEADQDARDLVVRLYRAAGVPPVDSVQSGTAPRTVELKRYACGLLPLEFQGQEWVRPPFTSVDPPEGFSGIGTATRKDDVLTYTDRLGAVVVLVPRAPGQASPDCG